jgi:hypothetical protein
MGKHTSTNPPGKLNRGGEHCTSFWIFPSHDLPSLCLQSAVCRSSMVPRPPPCFTGTWKECLREEIDGASNDDNHVLLPWTMSMAAQIHKQLSQGFLSGRKMHKKYMEGQEL